MKNKKSAKDVAFEKERAKYRKRIRELEHEISELKLLVKRRENEIHILQSGLTENEDWIRRLLEYTELSEDDMRAFLEKEKMIARSVVMFGNFFDKIPSIYKIRSD